MQWCVMGDYMSERKRERESRMTLRMTVVSGGGIQRSWKQHCGDLLLDLLRTVATGHPERAGKQDRDEDGRSPLTPLRAVPSTARTAPRSGS